MNQTLLSDFGTPVERVERALDALRMGAASWCLMMKTVKTKVI
jgi:hypothetical protein